MDTTDPDISFDRAGVCNHCHSFDVLVARRLVPIEQRPARLAELVETIKREGRGREYDCIIGVSGGLDSTYVAYLTQQLGLRPLAVHFDNGWDSELAVANIEKTVKRLGIDLFTYVVDWPEFRDLQVSFLRASTPDGEVPTDHAIVALLYQQAAKLGLKHVLLGVNVNSEAIMPLKWGYGYSDIRYISDVQRRFGAVPLKTLPRYTLLQLFNYMFLRHIKLVPLLDYVDYRKQSAMREIESALGWVYYGGKHYESVYTRFFQSYVLPRKFNIDKRRAHYSNLVLSGQMDRSEAVRLIDSPTHTVNGLKEDCAYAVKKLGLTEVEFAAIMDSPPRTFFDYDNNYAYVEWVKRLGVRRRT
jgi:N-acetyl sugar amidotransferase